MLLEEAFSSFWEEPFQASEESFFKLLEEALPSFMRKPFQASEGSQVFGSCLFKLLEEASGVSLSKLLEKVWSEPNSYYNVKIFYIVKKVLSIQKYRCLTNV